MQLGSSPAILLMGLTAAGSPEKIPDLKSIRDCPKCPEMVVLPDGEFLQGSPESEPGRYPNEGPQKPVRVSSFAIARMEITRGQFAEFIAETGREMPGGCYTPGDLADLLSDLDTNASWREPGFYQTDQHPVVCVTWHDAKTYADWLSTRTGHRYRLPTEIEWEYAARAGTSSAYYWGEDGNRECERMNGGDLTLDDQVPLWGQRTREEFDKGERNSVLIQCRDGSAFTSPVGRYVPNAFGLNDTLGNAWEWVEDCGDPADYSTPASGQANCRRRRTRGGSWDDWPVDLRSAVRKRLEPTIRRNDTGFRLVRELDRAAPQ